MTFNNKLMSIFIHPRQICKYSKTPIVNKVTFSEHGEKYNDWTCCNLFKEDHPIEATYVIQPTRNIILLTLTKFNRMLNKTSQKNNILNSALKQKQKETILMLRKQEQTNENLYTEQELVDYENGITKLIIDYDNENRKNIEVECFTLQYTSCSVM
jgi:hypothetical protein